MSDSVLKAESPSGQRKRDRAAYEQYESDALNDVGRSSFASEINGNLKFNMDEGKESEVGSSDNPRKPLTFAERMMKSMGYEGGGLGANGGGRAEPVKADMDRLISATGLGYHQAVKHAEHEYLDVKVVIKMSVKFVPQLAATQLPMLPATTNGASYKECTWLTIGPKTVDIVDASYCSPKVQVALLDAKSIFDTVEDRAFLNSRDRANPFELLKKEIFQNRAALKMAEIDSQCERAFTSPKSLRVPVAIHPDYAQYASPALTPSVVAGAPGALPLQPRELLYFADICAGPGGFTEYMLTVNKWRAQGFGFTLRGPDDFKLSKFNPSAPTQTFRGYYGPDNTGDITVEANMVDFANHTWKETRGRGLHVVLADGGFSVAGKENYQELLSRQLILCQCITALATLRKGGAFVCKLFDTFLKFTVDCLYFLRMSFEEVAIVKPNQSRPANSERYVFCRGLRERGGLDAPIVLYLMTCNRAMNDLDPLRDQERLLVGLGFDHIQSAPTNNALSGAAAGIMFVNGERLFDTEGNGNCVSNNIVVKEEENDQRKNEDGSITSMKEPTNLLKGRQTVLSLIPDSLIDSDFRTYITEFNELFATQQTEALRRVKRYLEDPNLKPDDQASIRLACLKEWKVPEANNFLATPPAYYVPYDKDWGYKLFAKEPGKAKNNFVGEGPQYEPMRHFLRTILAPHLQRHFHEFALPEAPALATGSEELLKIYQAAVHKSVSDVLKNGKQSPDGWFAIALPKGVRGTLLLPPKNRQCSYFAQPNFPQLSSSAVGGNNVTTGGQVDAPKYTSIEPLNAPADAIIDVMRCGEALFAFDAWSLPSPDLLQMYASKPMYRDRASLLSMFVDAIREAKLKFVCPHTLRAFFQKTSSSATSASAVSFESKSSDVSEVGSRTWPLGHFLYIFRGDGAKPAPGFLFKTSSVSPSGISTTSLSSAIETEQKAIRSVLKFFFES